MINNIIFLFLFIFSSCVRSREDFEVSIKYSDPENNYLKNKVYRNYTFFLICEFIGLENYEKLMLQWTSHPYHGSLIEKDKNNIKSTAIIKPITGEKIDYTCRVTQGQHIFQVNLKVPIRNSYLSFIPNSGSNRIIINQQYNMTPITLGKILADPMPKVSCYFQSIVVNDFSKSIYAFVEKNELKLHLGIFDVTSSGNYFLFLENILHSYDITIEILLEGVYIKRRKLMYLQSDHIGESLCEVYSYPPVNTIGWLATTDRTCNVTTSDYSYLILLPSSPKLRKINTYNQISSINFTNKKKYGSMSYICCVASYNNDNFNFKSVSQIFIGKLADSKVLYSDQGEINDNIIILNLDTELKLTCEGVTSMYKKIFWCKNLEGIKRECNLSNRDDLGIKIINEISTIKDTIRSSLVIKSANMIHNGFYQCKLSPIYFPIEYETNLDFPPVKILVNPDTTTWLHFTWSSIVIVLLITMIFLGIKYYKLYKIKYQLKQLGLGNFKRGKPESLNPEFSLDEQAHLLPYDKSYELHPETIVFGKLLGQGAFGSVYQGVLMHKSNKLNCFKIQEEKSQVVAIKMLKEETDISTLRALADELKMLQHIGKHPNIILLIGACTKSLHRSDLMIIVEYCKYGALQDYLRSQRNSFGNQLDSQSDKIMLKLIQRQNLIETEDELKIFYRKMNGNNDYKLLEKDCPTICTMATSFNNIENTECKNIVFNSTDLVEWSLQIANGMNFLSNLKIVHGDLAARNLLLTNNFEIKICDFGMAKRIYESKNYIKLTGKQLVPVRWYAIEAIEDLKLSTEADVWSFGVCLWELFSLGRMPYADIEIIDSNFLKKLYNGFRLSKPEFSNTTIYNLMLDCWKLNPDERPTFQFMFESFDIFLNKGYVQGSSLPENENNQFNYATIEFSE